METAKFCELLDEKTIFHHLHSTSPVKKFDHFNIMMKLHRGSMLLTNLSFDDISELKINSKQCKTCQIKFQDKEDKPLQNITNTLDQKRTSN